MNIITIFMNSEKSKTSDPHRLLLKRSDNYIALSNLSIYYTLKNVKKSCKNNKFKISSPTWNKKLNYQMDDILYQIFKI